MNYICSNREKGKRNLEILTFEKFTIYTVPLSYVHIVIRIKSIMLEKGRQNLKLLEVQIIVLFFIVFYIREIVCIDVHIQ